MKKIKKQFHNSFWIFSEKISKIVLYFLISILLARYLGPNDFGIFSIIITILTISSGLSAIGLNGILIKEYVITDNIYKVLLSAIIARVIGVTTALFISLFILWFWFFEYLGQPLLLLVSLSISFSLVQIADLYFESRLEASISAKYRIAGYLLGSIIKLYLLLNGYGYKYLIVAHLIELFIIFFLGYKTLLRNTDSSKFSKELLHIDIKYIQSLFQKGWPLLVSGIAVILYMKIDQFFIFNYLDGKNVGLYSAATRLCEGLFILSAIIVPSFFPSLIRYHKDDKVEYKKLLKKITTYLLLLGFIVTLVVFLFSKEIILLLYGNKFIESYKVLAIYALSIPIIYAGDVLSKWLIIEDLVKYSIIRHSLGLLVNITFNIILIPIYGIEGAAIASVLAYFSSVFLFVLVIPKARVFLFTIIARIDK